MVNMRATPNEEGTDEKYAEVRTALERASTLTGANDLLIAPMRCRWACPDHRQRRRVSKSARTRGGKLARTLTSRWIEIVRPASRRPRFVGYRDQIIEYAYYEIMQA